MFEFVVRLLRRIWTVIVTNAAGRSRKAKILVLLIGTYVLRISVSSYNDRARVIYFLVISNDFVFSKFRT